jgi:hypothetical protein
MEPRFESLLQRLEQLSAEVQELREGIRQSVTIAAQDPEMSLTRARKVLEYIVRDVYQNAYAEAAGTRPLENLLQRLVKDEHLPKRLAAYANGIRELGNVGTHGFGEGVTVQDVYQSLTQLVPIVEWYFQQRGPSPAAPPVAPPAPDAAPAQGAVAAPVHRLPSAQRSRRWLMVAAVPVLLGVVVLLLHGTGGLFPKNGSTGTAPPRAVAPFDAAKALRWLQQEGPFALLGGPDVVKELKLTGEQRTRFTALAQETPEKIERIIKEAQSKGNPEEIRPKLMNLRKEYEGKIEVFLTQDQANQWKELLDKPFAIPGVP